MAGRSLDRRWIQVPPSNGNQRQGGGYRSPVRDQIESCGLRRCRYARSQIDNDPYSTQKLLDKIQCLKKSLQDLEAAQRQPKAKNVEQRDAPCQTPELTPSDIYNIRDMVNSCITEMTKLKVFLDDENCWWKIFKKRDFNCCDQKLPHLHGFLDGTMVTLKMLDETLQPDKDIASSTPVKAFEAGGKPDDREGAKPGEPAKDCNREKTYADAAVNTGRSIDFAGAKLGTPSAQQCHMACGAQPKEATLPASSDGPVNETSFQQRPFRPEDIQRRSRDRQQTFYSLPDGSGTNDAAWSNKGPRDAEEGPAQQDRPAMTFSSENMARRSIIAKDMSTSMEALASDTIDSAAELTDERNFSLNTNGPYPRDRSSRVKKQAQQK